MNIHNICFCGKIERYQHFSNEKSASFVAMHIHYNKHTVCLSLKTARIYRAPVAFHRNIVLY